ncbi:MAG: protein-disulfide reductase DsbD domain-containing protein, partial [Halieaceae bacterium]
MVYSSPVAALRRSALALLLAVAGLFGSLSVLGQGLSALVQESNEFLPVEQAYHLEIEQVDATTLRLYWQIEPGYYLYQHRFKVVMTD